MHREEEEAKSYLKEFLVEGHMSDTKGWGTLVKGSPPKEAHRNRFNGVGCDPLSFPWNIYVSQCGVKVKCFFWFVG